MTQLYEIRIAGHLDERWQDWFDGMTVTLEEDGNTLLSAPVPDQPALYGILRRVRDLDLPPVSVHQHIPHKQRIRIMGFCCGHNSCSKQKEKKRFFVCSSFYSKR